MKNKIIICIVAILLVVVGLITFFVIKSNSKKAEDLEASNKIEISSNVNLEEYVGYWFLNKDKIDDKYIHIKEVNYNSVKLDMYFPSNTYINDVEVVVDEDTGNIDYSNGDSSFKGTLYFYDNQIVITITESTYEGADLGETYRYGYIQDSLEKKEDEPIKRIEGPVLSSSYAGTWYEGYDTDYKNNLLVMGIDGMTINMYLTINDVSFRVIKAEIVDNKGSFETYTRDDESKISGDILLTDNSIEIKINESNVEGISNNTSYMFKFKAHGIHVNDYISKWYLNDNKDDKNYIEIKSINGGVLVFDFVYGDKAQIMNVSASIKNNIATFKCVDGSERVLAGNVILDNNKVIIAFKNSTIVKDGTIIEFGIKGGS